MTNSNIDYNQVSRSLENNSHIKISSENEWFKQCVDFFKSDNPNCDTNDLSSMVVEQLSLSDFQEIALSSLPANLNSCEKKILFGKYCLQVNTILDVGHSCYSQYNILIKRDTSNTEIGDTKPAPWEPKSHRMLKMDCTDGQQNVLAMEYEPLSCLKEPFIPGFKIAVIGPVEYRKGVILLKSNNVHFIGGEVEHLLIKNAPLNVLCKALKKPELENPYMFSNIEVENTGMEVQESYNTNLIRPTENVFRPQNTSEPHNHTNQNNNNNCVRPTENVFRTQNTREPHNNTNQNNYSNFVGNGVITYDDYFDGDEDELLYLTQVAEIETKIAQSNNAINSTSSSTSTYQPNTKINKPAVSISNNKNTGAKKMQTSTAKQTKISDMLGPSMSKTSHSSFYEIPRHQNDIPVKNNSGIINEASGKRVASSPVHAEFKKPLVEYDNPEDINDIGMDVNSVNPLVKVLKSASVVKYSKIQVKLNEWICSGIVMDGINNKEVEFSSEVLERLIGVSPKEAIQYRNNPLNCALLKEKIEKGIKGAIRKLHLFKGEMTLTYSLEGNKKPIVTNMTL